MPLYPDALLFSHLICSILAHSHIMPIAFDFKLKFLAVLNTKASTP